MVTPAIGVVNTPIISSVQVTYQPIVRKKWGHPLEVSGQAAMSIPLYFYLKNQVSLLHYNYFWQCQLRLKFTRLASINMYQSPI